MLNIALQIDPPASLKPAGDSSLLLGREALRRGHRLYYLKPESVSLASSGEVVGEVAEMNLFAADATPFYELGEPRRVGLEYMDVVLVRQDPPFDMGYISNSLMLERLIENRTLVLNHPLSVRNHPEKMLPFRFSEYCPPTLISAEAEPIREFQKQYGAVVVKPAYGYGGRGVMKVSENGDDLEDILQGIGREPLVVQQFLPDVTAEEKRIVLIDGKVAGAFGRIPPEGGFIANMAAGGTPVATELTQRQHDVADDVGRFCASVGLMLVGLDVIGDWLTEINVTSPGLMQLKELYSTAPEKDFWDAVERVMGRA